MAAEDREMMEARGAGESCPTFPKMVPGDSKSEGKPRACLEAESQKPDSSSDYLEEMEACEDGGCQGPLKSLSPKSCPATKGQAGDGPKPAELPLAPGTERNPEMELEKVRMEFELTRLKYLHEENERQRQHEVVMGQLQWQLQHEVVMEQLQQEAAPRLFSGGLQNLLLPQNQFAMFLYCFIFIHIIYVTKEMVFFLFAKHYLFCIAAILLCLIKTFWREGGSRLFAFCRGRDRWSRPLEQAIGGSESGGPQGKWPLHAFQLLAQSLAAEVPLHKQVTL
ncbi:PREDICTED: transmembrane protein 247 [Colobus angolensis palliatus]|uniref:transmembrane protein 247 n=1 Tax=Colobus angolensis palliatus TaxID=336983 RepID=UPI0005F48D42|nr:PREDICTED: transmembrane protein 247 [Colobus angolensis palliatus]